MHDVSPAIFVAFAVLGCACSRSHEPDRGPLYTPAVANLLNALAGDCAFTRADGLEHRTCRGRQATMTIDLGPDRNIRALEIIVVASSSYEAAEMLKPVLPAVASPTLIDAIARRITRNMAMPDEELEGVTVHVRSSNPKFTVGLRW